MQLLESPRPASASASVSTHGKSLGFSFVLIFEIGSSYVAQTVLKLTTALRPQPPRIAGMSHSTQLLVLTVVQQAPRPNMHYVSTEADWI